MLELPVLITLGIIIVAALGFVLGAMLWLKNMRANLSAAVLQGLERQLAHGKKVEEALVQLQQNQKKMEGQILILAEAQRNARQDINTLAQRFELSNEVIPPQSRAIH